MKLLKRWSTGIVSRIDHMVSQIENQEALVDSAIREARQAAARAKVQLKRVRQDGVRLATRIAEERESQNRWKQRALRFPAEEEKQALECLRRSRHAASVAQQLEERLKEHHKAEHQLARDVGAIDERLATLTEKRNLLRSRQSRAEAFNAVQGTVAAVAEDIEDIFERWETRISENEITGLCGLQDHDDLETTLTSAEAEEELRMELEELRKATDKN